MGLAKSRKPYPRSVLLLEDSKGEFELEGKYYKMVYKVSTSTGIQQHLRLPKHRESYGEALKSTYFQHVWDIDGVRGRTTNGKGLIVDVWLYEQKTGTKLVTTPPGMTKTDLDLVSEIQAYAIKKIDEVKQSADRRIEELSIIAEKQSAEIQRLSDEIEVLKQQLNKHSSRKAQDGKKSREVDQLVLFE